MGMKTIGFPGEDLVFKSTPWLSAIERWLFARGAGYQLSNIGYSPKA
jgi:hypothetical protein